jgi:hypothetical protein
MGTQVVIARTDQKENGTEFILYTIRCTKYFHTVRVYRERRDFCNVHQPAETSLIANQWPVYIKSCPKTLIC